MPSEALRDRPLATVTRSGGISDKITFLSQWALKMLLEIVPVFISMKQKHRIADTAPNCADEIPACGAIP